MAVVSIEMFTWRDCAVCGHEVHDHHDHLPHYGCGCILSMFRPAGEYNIEVWVRGRSVHRYYKDKF